MSSEDALQYGEVKSSYFWDDGSGINGDTGMPASGEPMQKGLAASPSWPLGTEGYVLYDGKKADFFIGDRGPGDPAENCDVLLDLDGQTFAELTDESWNDTDYTVSGGNGHIDVEYVITEWGDGDGNEGAPHPMSESQTCEDAVAPVPDHVKSESQQEADESEAEDEQAQEEAEQREQEEQQQEQQEQEQEQQQEQQEEEQQQEDEEQDVAAGTDLDAPVPDSADGGAGAENTSTEATTSDLAGIDLMGADTPAAAGALTLALLPALIAAVLFARRRSLPAEAAAGGDGRSDNARSGLRGWLSGRGRHAAG